MGLCLRPLETIGLQFWILGGGAGSAGGKTQVFYEEPTTLRTCSGPVRIGNDERIRKRTAGSHGGQSRRRLGTITSRGHALARAVLLPAVRTAYGTGRSADSNDAIELLMGRFTEHDDADLPPIRSGCDAVCWRYVLRHSSLAQQHKPIRDLSSPRTLVAHCETDLSVSQKALAEKSVSFLMEHENRFKSLTARV